MALSNEPLDVVVLGLSITSSWGNGHATTYRALLRELARQGHGITFLERDVPWYAEQRDMPRPGFCRTELYCSLDDLRDRFTESIRHADLVIVGSYVPDGVEVGAFVQQTAHGAVAFYDINTPVTLAKLNRHDYEYLSPHLIPGYHLYLSFTGGPILRHMEQHYASPAARALYCSVDPELYRPMDEVEKHYDLGYLGTWSADRQPTLERLLIEPARHWPQGNFAVFGSQYPPDVQWPDNVARRNNMPPSDHAAFYNAQCFTLNVTRADMIRAGFCPSVRLFEAAACGTPIISDCWSGLDTLFEPGREILICATTAEALDVLQHLPEDSRREIGLRGRRRVLSEHTAAQRASQLVEMAREALDRLPSEAGSTRVTVRHVPERGR